MRVCFEGGDDEEWVEVSDVRALGSAGAHDGGSVQNLADAAYWLAAGVKNADFTSAQAELLEELLEYRLAPGVKCLELGAGARSFVPVDRVGSLVGVGLVSEHLQLNGLLTSFEVADLNGADLDLPLEAAAFDAVICNSLPYLMSPERVVGEACRCVQTDGVVAFGWTSNSQHAEKMAPAWRALSGSEQVTLVKELLTEAGMHPQSMRVDVSGPTDGDKLFLVSASPAAPKKKPAAADAVKLRVQDAVGPQELLHALKDKSKKRADARRQKEHDEKPFRVKVVSPPPETLLDDVFNFHPRWARVWVGVGFRGLEEGECLFIVSWAACALGMLLCELVRMGLRRPCDGGGGDQKFLSISGRTMATRSWSRASSML